MENTDMNNLPEVQTAEQYCAKKGINYILLEDVILKDECTAEAARCLYKSMIANNSSARWGVIYFGCYKSKLFTSMSRAVYIDAFSMVFPCFPAEATAKRGIDAAEFAIKKKGTELDDTNSMDIRSQIKLIKDMLDEMYQSDPKTT